MTLVTLKAPDFTSSAVLNNGEIINNFNFYNFTKNKYSVIFFWPMDFTFVCPSELISFDKRYMEFKKRNTKIIGISIDSEFVHNFWRKTPLSNGGVGIIRYPMVSDIKKNIMRSYGIEHPNLGIALRASFLIDKNKIIRHQVINDLPFGRNINEIIRMIDALQFYEKNGEVCPAQWKIGHEGITATPEGISKYLSKNYKNL